VAIKRPLTCPLGILSPRDEEEVSKNPLKDRFLSDKM
jgi:hypothetical protein